MDTLPHIQYGKKTSSTNDISEKKARLEKAAEKLLHRRVESPPPLQPAPAVPCKDRLPVSQSPMTSAVGYSRSTTGLSPTSLSAAAQLIDLRQTPHDTHSVPTPCLNYDTPMYYPYPILSAAVQPTQLLALNLPVYSAAIPSQTVQLQTCIGGVRPISAMEQLSPASSHTSSSEVYPSINQARRLPKRGEAGYQDYRKRSNVAGRKHREKKRAEISNTAQELEDLRKMNEQLMKSNQTLMDELKHVKAMYAEGHSLNALQPVVKRSRKFLPIARAILAVFKLYRAHRKLQYRRTGFNNDTERSMSPSASIELMVEQLRSEVQHLKSEVKFLQQKEDSLTHTPEILTIEVQDQIYAEVRAQLRVGVMRNGHVNHDV